MTAPNAEEFTPKQPRNTHALRMLFGFYDHGSVTLLLQNTYLLSPQTPDHHRIVGSDENLRIPSNRLHLVLANHSFDFVEVTQFPYRVQMRVRLIKQEQAMILAGHTH